MLILKGGGGWEFLIPVDSNRRERAHRPSKKHTQDSRGWTTMQQSGTVGQEVGGKEKRWNGPATRPVYRWCWNAGQASTSSVHGPGCAQHPLNNADLKDSDRTTTVNRCSEWTEPSHVGATMLFSVVWNGDAEGCIASIADKSHLYNLDLNPSLQSSHRMKGQKRAA